MRENRDRSAARVEAFPASKLGRDRQMIAVILTHPIAVRAVDRGGAERFNPGMLVGRNGLRCELTAYPVGLFRHDDAHSVAARCQRSRTAAYTSANDRYVATKFPRCEERRRQ